MVYYNLGEICTAQDVSLRKIRERVQGLTSAQAEFHSSSGGWSIGEIMEHVSIVDGQLVQLVSTLLTKTEEAGKNAPAVASPISLQAVFEQGQKAKYVTRDAAVPRGKKTIAESLQLLQDQRGRLAALQPRLRSVDLSFATFPHWIFGSLSLGQWLAFIGLHEERHLAQIETITASPDFPGMTR